MPSRPKGLPDGREFTRAPTRPGPAMRAMILDAPGRSLRAGSLPTPQPGAGEVLIQVRACGVCRTDLHVADGELPNPKLPLVLGHEIVGTVAAAGAGVNRFALGDRVGVPWLGWTCGECRFCRTARENLCERARFTGYQIDGGYAEYTVADARYCFALPRGYSDAEAAPLLCAGLIGYRALVAAGGAERLGLYGFGGAAHLVAQVARHEGRRIFAFTRPGDTAGQRFAKELGAVWAGGPDAAPPEPLDAAVIFAPPGPPLAPAPPGAGKGGAVVGAGVHISDIPTFPHDILCGEGVGRPVAEPHR